MSVLLPSFAMDVPAVFVQASPIFPLADWWVVACVIAILALAAIIDTFTGLIPETLIFLGLALVTAIQGFSISWDNAALHLRHAIAAGLAIWGINRAWRKKFHHDALGMGDAKWTMLAVACFGIIPSVFAWGVGAILAVCFIGVLHLSRRKITRVTFAPFLFVGLLAGIYWLRFRI